MFDLIQCAIRLEFTHATLPYEFLVLNNLRNSQFKNFKEKSRQKF